MIDNLKDIKFDDAKNAEDMDKILRDNLGIGCMECAQVLSEDLLTKLEDCLEELPNMAPYGDYDKLTEDPQVILKFLKEEASKPENWKLQYVDREEKSNLLKLIFFNMAVDDGDILKGFVFIGLSGKIRHAFTQVQS
jgi:hypothetical protein